MVSWQLAIITFAICDLEVRFDLARSHLIAALVWTGLFLYHRLGECFSGGGHRGLAP
jgi:hypothetical protein